MNLDIQLHDLVGGDDPGAGLQHGGGQLEHEVGGEGPGPAHQQDQPRALVVLQRSEGAVRRGGQLGRREVGPWLGGVEGEGEGEGEGRGARGRRGGVVQHMAPIGAQVHLAGGVLTVSVMSWRSSCYSYEMCTVIYLKLDQFKIFVAIYCLALRYRRKSALDFERLVFLSLITPPPIFFI